MIEYLKLFEKTVVIALILMMAVVVLLTTVEMGISIGNDIIAPPVFLLEISHLMKLFGDFMLILIGIELLETTKLFLTDKIIHVEIVILVAIMAIARKVIILDVKKLDSLTLIGIGVVVITLAGSYYLIKRSQNEAQ